MIINFKMSFKDFIYYIYYRIYCAGIYISNDFLKNIKPSIIFCFLVLSLIVQMHNWYCIISDTNSIIQIPALGIFSIVIAYMIFDYFVFSRNYYWKIYIEKFKHFTKKQFVFWDIIVVIVIIIILTSFCVSAILVGKNGLRKVVSV